MNADVTDEAFFIEERTLEKITSTEKNEFSGLFSLVVVAVADRRNLFGCG
jgi:hypothetical protein